jgi:hypothetical protein
MSDDGKFTEYSAKKIITRNRGTVKGRNIHINNPGLKVLSAIDFLINHHEYHWIIPVRQRDV